MHLVESRQAMTESKRRGGGLLRRTMVAMVSLCGGAWAGGRSGAPRHMRVVETLAIGPKKQLLLVSCDGERYLVGTGADSVQSILRLGSRANVRVAGRVAVEPEGRS